MLKIEEVALRVKDLEKMKTFYQKVIGLEVISENENEVLLGKPYVRLIAGAKGVNQAAHTGLYHMAFLLPTEEDLSEFIHHLISNKTEIQGGSDHIFSQAIYLNDPEGNGIEVYADRKREFWQEDATGLVAASLPLQIEKLLELAKKEYKKIPEGTIMGHVHLEVADIYKAKEFYVDKLGFETMTDMGTALFVSKDGYHHHFGMNVWRGAKSPLPKDATGLLYVKLHMDDVESGVYHDPFGIELRINQ